MLVSKPTRRINYRGAAPPAHLAGKLHRIGWTISKACIAITSSLPKLSAKSVVPLAPSALAQHGVCCVITGSRFSKSDSGARCKLPPRLCCAFCQILWTPFARTAQFAHVHSDLTVPCKVLPPILILTDHPCLCPCTCRGQSTVIKRPQGALQMNE